MRRKWILYFDLPAIARERVIPAASIAQTNLKIVDVFQRTLDLLARRQRHDRNCMLAFWIKHVRFEFDRRVLACDTRQIAAGRMAPSAATSSVKKSLPGIGITSEQFFYRIHFRNTGRLDRLRSAGVQICRDVAYLLIAQGHCRHPLLRAALMNNYADSIALYVMSHKRGPDQIRPTSTSRVRTVAKPAGLHELLAAALDCGVRSGNLGGSRRRRWTRSLSGSLGPCGGAPEPNQASRGENGYAEKYKFLESTHRSTLMPGHRHSSRGVFYLASSRLSIDLQPLPQFSRGLRCLERMASSLSTIYFCRALSVSRLGGRRGSRRGTCRLRMGQRCSHGGAILAGFDFQRPAQLRQAFLHAQDAHAHYVFSISRARQ